MYLTRNEVFAALRSIIDIAPTDIAPTSSMAIFDYTNTDAFISEKSPPQTQKFLELGKKIGEPMITGFNPSTLAEDLDSS
jgi:hypothetical protein